MALVAFSYSTSLINLVLCLSEIFQTHKTIKAWFPYDRTTTDHILFFVSLLFELYTLALVTAPFYINQSINQ